MIQAMGEPTPVKTPSSSAAVVAVEVSPEFSIVIPCLNEARTVETCIRKAKRCLLDLKVAGEIVVADNGSTDGSAERAARAGARVVSVAARGYGSAMLGGIAAARGEYVIMGDADDSYDFSELRPFIERLRDGYDLVMGNRFQGEIKPGAMPLLHRYLGNPILSGIGRVFFKCPCGDFHCGLRGFRREAVRTLGLCASGMEFASEMVVKAALHGLRIAEVPITLWPDGRSRAPHLRPWRDGWRHLRFLVASRCSRGMHGRRSGFTMIELLVVIGIITVLMAILLPVLSRVRQQAQEVACLSNVRQLTLAYRTYTGDNRGRGPQFSFSTSESWVQRFREDIKLSSSLYICPRLDDDAGPSFGSAHSSWTLTLETPTGLVKATGSYGFNGWLLRWEPVGKGGEQFSGGEQQRYVLPSIKGSDKVPVFADATWIDGWPRADDPTPPDLIGGDPARQGVALAPKENMMARFTIARHGRGINVAFLDGHAEKVSVGDLKRLKWHKDFVAQDWNPPLPKQ